MKKIIACRADKLIIDTLHDERQFTRANIEERGPIATLLNEKSENVLNRCKFSLKHICSPKFSVSRMLTNVDGKLDFLSAIPPFETVKDDV
jgi:hypothetical protein